MASVLSKSVYYWTFLCESSTQCEALEICKNRASRTCKWAGGFGQICKYGYIKYTNAAFISIDLDNWKLLDPYLWYSKITQQLTRQRAHWKPYHILSSIFSRYSTFTLRNANWRYCYNKYWVVTSYPKDYSLFVSTAFKGKKIILWITLSVLQKYILYLYICEVFFHQACVDRSTWVIWASVNTGRMYQGWVTWP